MIVYGQKEMDYLSDKDPVMAKLIAHYGQFELGVQQTVFSSLVTHIVSQMLSNKVGAVLNGRLHDLVGEYTPYCSVASLYYYAVNDDVDNWLDDISNS